MGSPRGCRRLHALGHRMGWDERGAAFVEFAMIAPVVALMAFMTLDFGHLYMTKESVYNAAREAAIYGASHPGQLIDYGGSCAAPNNATWRGQQEDSSDSVTFTFSADPGGCDPATLPSGLQPGQPLKVTAKASVTLITTTVFGISGPASVSASVCVNIDGTPSTTSCP